MNHSPSAAMPRENGNFSLLLSLPAELRNRVYEYALSSETGLLYVNDAVQSPHRPTLVAVSNSSHGIQTYEEFNQLKWVNKKLYDETAGLELKFTGRLTFAESAELPVQQFLMFTALLNPDKLSWLSTIVLKPDSNGNIEYLMDGILTALTSMSFFCRHNTEVKIEYVFPGFSVEDATVPGFQSRSVSFMALGQKLSMAFRGVDRLSWWKILHELSTTLLEDANEWRETNNLVILLRRIPNFRIYPEILEIDKDFVESFQHCVWRAGGTQALVNRWIEVTKDWVENGI